MYFTFNDYNSLEEVENRDREYDRDGKEIKEIINVKFRGLIATYKIFKSCNKLSKKSKFITFVTIGYDNCKYIDLVLWGCQKLSKAHCLEGVGTYEDGHWIKVSNFKYGYIK